MIRAGNVPDGMTVGEVNTYIQEMRRLYPDIKNGCLDLTYDGDEVLAKLTEDGDPPFQRIRRITGYLVGTLDRFNNAKRSEVDDRVKHISV